MKKLILSLLIITMLTGCVSEPVKQEEVMTAEVTTQAETIGNIDLDEEIKAYFTKELAGCMWEMLDEIGYFESETKNTEKSAYSFKDVNSDGKEDLIWRVSEYKFDYICVFILSDETVADSTYYLAGGSDGESDVIVHENNICEFISDTSSLWNEAKWHQYVDMSDFSVKLETMKTVSYDTEEENFYVIENDEQISVSEEEYKKSVEELFKDSGTPVLFMGEINDFGIYQNLEKEVSRILDFKEDEYLSLGAKKGMEYSRMVSKYFWTSCSSSWKVDEKSGFPDEDGERYNIRITGFLNEEETDGVSFEEIKKFFDDTLELQRETYELMFQNGWYILEEAEYKASGSTEDFELHYHRFWHQGDIMMALGAMALLYPDMQVGGAPVTTPGSSENPTATLPGDANCDGEVDLADAVLVKCYLINSAAYSISAEGKANADVQGDGNGLNAQDSLAILQKALKLIDKLPV